MELRAILIILSKPGRLKLSKTAIALIIIFLGGPFLALHFGEPYIREAQHKAQLREHRPFNEALEFYHAKNYKEATIAFEQLASEGDIRAMQILGVFFAQGLIVDQDTEKAKKYLQEPADNKYKKALTTLGFIYLNEGNFDLARTQFLVAINDSQLVGFEDDDYAKYGLGFLYSSPDYSEYDPVRAERYLSQAVDAGIEEAKFRLSTLWVQDDNYNPKKAFPLFSELANEGHKGARVALAYMYFFGEATEKDCEKAFSLAHPQAKQGDTRAIKLVARMYEIGCGVKQDTNEANSWYTKTAQ